MSYAYLELSEAGVQIRVYRTEDGEITLNVNGMTIPLSAMDVKVLSSWLEWAVR